LSEPAVSGDFLKTHECFIAKDHATTTVTIIDDDQPGELRFKVEELEVQEQDADHELRVVVDRFNGSTGKISCKYHFDSMGAVEGIDFEGAAGTVEFESGMQHASVSCTIKAKGRVTDGKFNLVLEEPEGTKFDATTDGGEDQCICHVVIKGKEGTQANLFGQMRERVNSANNVAGSKNWGQQFYDALFQVGDDDEEADEDAPTEVGSGPSKLDIFIHVVSVPWKLLFAFVPPVDFCGGWACFCCALVFIGVVTAIVGDMANLVGCCFDILPETAAITFVALGTSLPDTFASKAAAQMDPYADASIGNVVGSNSINVFMGIGVSWTLAAAYWEGTEPNTAWLKQGTSLTKEQQDNVAKAMEGRGIGKGSSVFVAPGGTLWFNLAVFSFNALCALLLLAARRKKCGGELGGFKKGFLGQYFSGAFLAAQWFIYVIASIVFARTAGDPMTYGQISAMESSE